MQIYEAELTIPAICHADDPLAAAHGYVAEALGPGREPIRFVVCSSDDKACQCEVGLIDDATPQEKKKLGSIFDFRQRGPENPTEFNVVFLVPTGIGSSIGGHAGDSTPSLRAIAEVCDKVILHPNVVNASDVNEMPDNALYVEGSVLARFLMGTVGLRPVRANRVLTVMDNHPGAPLRHATINTVNSARAVYGLSADNIVLLEPPILLSANYTGSGRASGKVDRMGPLLDLLEERRGTYDAVAIATVIDVPKELEEAYFFSDGGIINPWGGSEAILTHALSALFDVPTAHAPIDQEANDFEVEIVDPRMAAEATSRTYLQCVLKGLRQSPSIVHRTETGWPAGTLSAEDVSCLVVPDKAVGLPTLAALKQGITVIAVRENENILDNDLTKLPWVPGKFYQVDNYWEAAGVLCALKAGIDPAMMRRPISQAECEVYPQSRDEQLAPMAQTG